MTRTMQDLRDTLTSASADVPPGLDVLRGVHSKVHRTRRRNGSLIAIAAVTAAALVVGLSAYRAHTPSSHSLGNNPLPAHPGSLPQYLRGGKLIASQQSVGTQGVTLTFTPTSRRIGFVMGCRNQHSSAAPKTQGTLTVNGKAFLGISCGGKGEGLGLTGDSAFGRTPGWRKYGAVPGQPMTVRFAPASGTSGPSRVWRVGVYQAVPLSQFPFPPAPAKPAGLSSSLIFHGGGRRLIWDNNSPPSDPNGFTYSVPVQRGLTWLPESVAPGVLRMYVNGRLVATYWSWTYDIEMGQFSWRLHQLGIRPGSRVSISFTGQTHRDWWQAFAVYDSPGV